MTIVRPFDHRRCLVLSEKDSNPHFMWLAIRSDGTGARAAMDYLMKGDAEASTFKTNQQRCRKMNRHVMVRNREYFRIDESTPNQSIHTATAGLNTAPLLGPFLAFAYTEKDEVFHDSEMRDFRNLVDAFVNKRYKNLFGFPRPQDYPLHGKENYSYEHKLSRDGRQVIGRNEQGDVKTGPASIKGIKILCEGEAKEGKHMIFQEVMVPWNHDIFYQGIRSEVAYLVGILLLCMKLAPRHPLGSSTYSHNNPTTANLQRQLTKLPEESFGQTPKFWLKNVSNVVVVRSDRKAMSLEVMSSLHDFAHDHVGGLLKHLGSEDTNNNNKTIDQVLAEITPAKSQKACSVRVNLSMAGLSIVDKEDGVSDEKGSIRH